MNTRQLLKPRQLAVSAVFLLSVGYGVDELLVDDASPVEEEKLRGASTIRIDAVVAPEPGSGPALLEAGTMPEPSELALEEADRWRGEDWGRSSPFSGESWLTDRESKQKAKENAGAGTVLQGTSYSPEGWRAVLDGRVLRVGDEYLDGRIVAISEGRVVVRWANKETVLGFPPISQEKGE